MKKEEELITKKRVVADIPEWKHDRLRIKCLREHTSIQELLEGAIDKYLKIKTK